MRGVKVKRIDFFVILWYDLYRFERKIDAHKGEINVPSRRTFFGLRKDDWYIVAGAAFLVGAFSTLDLSWIVVLGVIGLLFLARGARGR